VTPARRPPTVGIRIPREQFQAGPSALREAVADVVAAGIDRVCVGDHVTFHGGTGFDGLVQATALAALCDLEVQTAVYLLPLRHPVPVARQVSSLAELAPGRFLFGVGVGGEDPAEVRACGVDPTTRGRRMDESLSIVRALLAGRTVTHRGEFFELDRVAVLPAPAAPVPIVVGGRSDAALRRAGRFGDGYLALWTTAERYVRSVAKIEQHAADAGRTDVAWCHGLHVWCGFDDAAEVARRRLAEAMESLYRAPFDNFERWCPWGTPAAVADALAPFVDAGCSHVNIIPVAGSTAEAVAAVAEVRDRLRALTPVAP
jgi:alkanesulfonate monooxygenase SsuD/methylene tetrahydromethanopterin reductase-like flavin-dependent oxidoreductase (luciferase family)